MARKKQPPVDWGEFLSQVPEAHAVEYGATAPSFGKGTPRIRCSFCGGGR
jgi:hypothetical protein